MPEKPQIQIRVGDAAESDAPLIAEMMCEFESFLYTLIGKKRSFSTRKFEKPIRAAMAGPEPLCRGLIAWQGKRPVGYILYHFGFATDMRKPALYIEDMFVRTRARRSGVGKKLMLAAKRAAKKRGCGAVIWTVWNLNPNALGFYLSLGAKPNDEEIIMEWDVGATRR